ncbi:hypothetical protein BXZ70DRAFT_1060770 [Cristinia sonorae]|uniref:SET domain-containing protein n=1 Tax=Cristinia sonorae TaxID=1940300 RepID=A0A8K0V0Y8_9AGAR|nr:hypothetical protein BXZ70DRAFT_1060770 [Cristinia sonorae]
MTYLPIPSSLKAAMTGLNPSMADITAFMASRGMPPNVAEKALRDPFFLERVAQDFPFLRTLAAPSPIPPTPRYTTRPRTAPATTSSRNLDEHTADFMAVLAVAFEQGRENHRREASLPPIKVPQIPRAILLKQYERPSATQNAQSLRSVTRQTYIGMVPGFSGRSLEQLKRISISEMMVRKRHTGYFLLCRIISQTVRIVSVDIAVEDPSGEASKLGIYHFPFTLNFSEEEADTLFPVGAILAIREPYYKFSSAGDVPMIRVDAPSDIVFLESHSPLLNGISWSTTLISVPTYPDTPDGWKARGVDQFKCKQWLCAAVSFSEGLRMNPSHPLLLLNRSEVYLRLRWFNSAAHDADAALALNLEDPMLRRKAILRAAKGYYSAGRYSEVARLAALAPKDTDIRDIHIRVTCRLSEMSAGSYDWLALYLEALRSTPAPRLDVASYEGPVEVRVPAQRGQPRGLFVSRDVKAGELLVVSKPIASYYPEDNPRNGQEVFMSHNLLTRTTGKRADYALIDAIRCLHAGSLATEAYPPPHTSQNPLPHPQISSVDIDIARVESVCSLNVFSLELLGTQSKPAEKLDKSIALYELPSFCNHSCMPSANRAFFGDVMVMRASRNLNAGDEVTLAYHSGTEPLGERSEHLTLKWGFTCQCLLCKADRADGSAAANRARMSKLPLPSTVLEALQRVAIISASYQDTPERRLCGVKPELSISYYNLGVLCFLEADRGSDPSYMVKSAEALLSALDAAGMVITDKTLHGQVRRASCLPVDTSVPPSFLDIVMPMVIRLTSVLKVLNQPVRVANWMKVAVWLNDLVAGGGETLLKKIYKPLFDSHARFD